MKRAIILVLALLLIVKGVTAQDTFPPDPSEIFTDAVEVMSVESHNVPENTFPLADDVTRTIHVYSFETYDWYDVAYPDGVTHVVRINRGNGNYVVYTAEPDPDSPANNAFILNATTGELAAAESVCDDRIRDIAGEGEWRFYHEGAEIYLCFTESGEHLGPIPLPDDLEWLNGSSQGITTPVASPSGDWFVLLGRGDTENGYGFFEIYGYQSSTETLNHIGHVENSSWSLYAPNVSDNWVSETQGLLIQNTMGETMADNWFAFDLSQSDSLQLAGFGMDFVENPPRYEEMTTEGYIRRATGAIASEHIPCRLSVYDETGIHSYELGYDCEMQENGYICGSGALRVNDDYLYIRFDADGFSALVELDTETGQFTTILPANDLASLVDVSPDGRYVILVLGPRLNVNYDAGCDVNWEIGVMPPRSLAIYDLEHRRFVYQTEAYADGDILWLNDNQLLLSLAPVASPVTVNAAGDMIHRSTSGSLRLVTLEDDGQTFAIAQYGSSWDSIQLTSDPQWALAHNSGYVLVHTATLNTIPIIQSALVQYYTFAFEWVENDLMTVELLSRSNYRQSVTYTIRITPTDSS